jgi:heptosyltransferase-2
VRKGSTGNSTACRSGRKELLVLAPNWIGDVVMATPFLALLRKENPDDFITVLCRDYVSELLSRSAFIDNLITYRRDGGVRRGIIALRGGRPEKGWDASFILPMSFSSALIAYLGGPARRFGYRGSGRDWLLTDWLRPDDHRKIHLSREYAALARLYSGREEDVMPAPCIIPPYDWKERLTGYSLNGRYVVFAAGAAYGPAKVWPHERFTALAKRLKYEKGLRTVTVGSAKEEKYLENITAPVDDALNLAGKSGIGDLMSILRGADLVVGNDSGPVHVSAAMGVPTVSIFGSTSPVWTSPQGPRSRIVTSGADCSPCFRKECPEGDTHCLRDIGVDDVFDAAMEIMRENEA